MARVRRIMVIRPLILAAAILSAGCTGPMPGMIDFTPPPAPAPPLPPAPKAPEPNIRSLSVIDLSRLFYRSRVLGDAKKAGRILAELNRRKVITPAYVDDMIAGRVSIDVPIYVAVAAWGWPDRVTVYEGRGYYTKQLSYGSVLDGDLRFIHVDKSGFVKSVQY